MQRRSGEALQRDRYRGRGKPSVTPDDNPEPSGDTHTREAGSAEDLAAALTNPEVSAVNLSGDVIITTAQSITRPVTLDLGGHKITTTQSGKTYMFNVKGDGVLTLKNGEVEANYRAGLAQNGGQIVVENGIYSSKNNAVFEARTNGKVTINGGTITGPEGAVLAPASSGIIEINGGILEGLDNFAISTNGNAGNNNNQITINDGQLIGNIRTSGYEAIGVYIANQDTFVMNGGSITAYGGTGLCMRGGNVTINGGTITATGTDKNGNPVADGKIGDDATVATGVSAIVYHKSSDYQNAGMQLTITGGTITGIDKSIDVIGMAEGEHPNITVTGGTLTPAYTAA